MKKVWGTGKFVKRSAFITFLLVFVCLAGCSKQFARIEENQSSIQSMIQENANQLAAMTEYIEQNKNELSDKINQVQEETQLVSMDLNSFSNEQTKFNTSSQNSINEIANQLKNNQEVIKSGLVVSHNETAKVANNLTSLEQKQAEFNNTVRNNNIELNKKVALLEEGQENLFLSIDDSKSKTMQVSSEVAAIGKEQVRLHETSQNKINQLASQVSDNQGVLKNELAISHKETAQVANDLAILQKKQNDFYNTVKNNNSALTEKVALLEKGQGNLLAGIEDSKSQTLQVSSEVAALSKEQARLHETSQSSITAIASQLEQVSSNQEVLKNGLVVSHNETAQVAKNLNSLEQKQSELYSAVENNNKALTEKVALLEKGQGNLLAGIEDSKSQTLKVSSEVAALGNEQVELNRTVQNNNNALTEKVALLEKGQGNLLTGIEESKSHALNISAELAILNNEQAQLHETSQKNLSELANQLSKVSSNQEILKNGLVVAHNETAKVANNVAELSGKQLELYNSSQQDIMQLAKSLSDVIQNQTILKAGLVVSHNESAKIGNEVASLNSIQLKINKLIEDNNTYMTKKVASIEEKQSELQAGFEEMQNETRVVAESISYMGQEQTNLQETVNSYNQQMSERVDLIEQGSQEWQATINEMQKSVQEVAGNIGTFEQNLSKLQEILQGKMGEMVTASNASNQVQTEFQEKIKKDLVALADSVNVVKQSQSQLQKKIEEVQTKTESMAVEFPVAIEKLRKEMTVDEVDAYSVDN